MLQLERNTVVLPQLERSSESPASTLEELSQQIEIRPQHSTEEHHVTTREEPRHTSLQERSTHRTIREVQLTTTREAREEPTPHIWRRATPHIAENPCPMLLERRPPQLEI